MDYASMEDMELADIINCETHSFDVRIAAAEELEQRRMQLYGR